MNQICATYGIGLKIFELALDLPTADITLAPAMDEAACAGTIAFGMEAVAGEVDVLALGEMGIGNTTVASAIFAALYGGTGADWVGRGTGVDDPGLARKAAAVDAALATHAGNLKDPLEVLRRLGGREIAALCGAILAARMQRVPVVLDGFVVTAAAAVLHALDPTTIEHCLAGHVSAEQAHRRALEKIGKTPILDLGMRLGEGSRRRAGVGIDQGRRCDDARYGDLRTSRCRRPGVTAQCPLKPGTPPEGPPVADCLESGASSSVTPGSR